MSSTDQALIRWTPPAVPISLDKPARGFNFVAASIVHILESVGQGHPATLSVVVAPAHLAARSFVVTVLHRHRFAVPRPHELDDVRDWLVE